MQNDRLFITYAMALVLGISTVATLMISMGAGHFPGTGYLVEHVSLGLMIRGYYKSFDGESGFYAIVHGVRNYFGISEEAAELPAGAAAATN